MKNKQNFYKMKTEISPIESIKALTWKQPFADLMIYGDKVETRTWKTAYRGWVLICAGKKSYTGLEKMELMGDVQYYRALDVLSKIPKQSFSHLGKAIGIGKLVDCRPMVEADADRCFVEYKSEYLFCHVYENVKSIKPFCWIGSQGWKNLSDQERNILNQSLL